VISLREVWIYPVKSLPGVKVQAGSIDDRGLVGDRRFMVVDPGGRFVTQRERPRLALVEATLGETLRLRTPAGAAVEVPLDVDEGEREVTVWGDAVPAVDAGDDAAALLSGHLDADVRLVRMPGSTRRAADPGHARDGDLVSFADGFPFLLVSRASVDAIAARVDGPIDVRRFRPNLVVDGVDAFAEDDWTTFGIGDVTFHARKPCARCQVVDVDPDTGRPGRGVLKELARSRRRGNAALFGQNLVHDGPGVVRVGDAVRAIATA